MSLMSGLRNKCNMRKIIVTEFMSLDGVFDTTYLGMLLNLSAKPASSVLPGHAVANASYVIRPKRSASEACSSSSLNFANSSFPYGIVHPSYLNPDPSGPGASKTPSRDMNSVTIIFLILHLFLNPLIKLIHSFQKAFLNIYSIFFRKYQYTP